MYKNIFEIDYVIPFAGIEIRKSIIVNARLDIENREAIEEDALLYLQTIEHPKLEVEITGVEFLGMTEEYEEIEDF